MAQFWTEQYVSYQTGQLYSVDVHAINGKDQVTMGIRAENDNAIVTIYRDESGDSETIIIPIAEIAFLRDALSRMIDERAARDE